MQNPHDDENTQTYHDAAAHSAYQGEYPYDEDDDYDEAYENEFEDYYEDDDAYYEEEYAYREAFYADEYGYYDDGLPGIIYHDEVEESFDQPFWTWRRIIITLIVLVMVTAFLAQLAAPFLQASSGGGPVYPVGPTPTALPMI